jgi:hypothetical protein
VENLLSLQSLYILLQDFLAPFQGHLKLSEVNQNFNMYLTAQRSHCKHSENECINKVPNQFPGPEDRFTRTKVSGKVHPLRNLYEMSYVPSSCPDFLTARKQDLFSICNHTASPVVYSYLNNNLPISKVTTKKQSETANAETHTKIQDRLILGKVELNESCIIN